MSQQEKEEFEARYKKFSQNCDYLMRTKTEKEFDHFLAFRAQRTIHRLGKKR